MNTMNTMKSSGTKNTKPKRTTVSEDENKEDTPLSRLVNFGPVTLPELESLGFKTLSDLRKSGWEEVCRKWTEYYPERLNVNAFIGIVATLEGISWTKISSSQRSKARRLVNILRRELSLPLTKPAKRKKP